MMHRRLLGHQAGPRETRPMVLPFDPGMARRSGSCEEARSAGNLDTAVIALCERAQEMPSLSLGLAPVRLAVCTYRDSGERVLSSETQKLEATHFAHRRTTS